MAKKNWSDLSPTQQKAVVAVAVAEVALTAWVLRDLKRRDSAQVRGPKLLWRAASAVQPFGPLGYLAFGRRRTS
ncbi:PLDc N-terminal domain-containing protein [Nocardioides alcanivorans]|uniref:PLDc N-terminal domain-containing protein n=1 Tax=Nocardioides alcanivorans TaxID=2897352 RepID=UPI001F2696BE|nr:PLDc N-terminal domain-containing protein [Nocardioides alcanivorans]